MLCMMKAGKALDASPCKKLLKDYYGCKKAGRIMQAPCQDDEMRLTECAVAHFAQDGRKENRVMTENPTGDDGFPRT